MKIYYINPDEELDRDGPYDLEEKVVYYLFHPWALIVYLLLFCAKEEFLK